MITRTGCYTADCVPAELVGLSTDPKPTDVPNTSVFYEMDTKALFMFDAENQVWLEQ